MNIIREVKKLNLPLGKYLVIGSSSLAVRGIEIKPRDIDILVLPELFRKLALKKYFKKEEFPDGNIALIKGSIEIVHGTTAIGYNPKVIKALIDNAEVIGGISFSKLDDEVKFRKVVNRAKDTKIIPLIKNHIALHKEKGVQKNKKGLIVPSAK